MEKAHYGRSRGDNDHVEGLLDEDHSELTDEFETYEEGEEPEGHPGKSRWRWMRSSLSLRSRSQSLPYRPLWYTKLKSFLFPSSTSNSDIDSFIPNYRYTPILSGLIIPFAILLEIPGLTEHWYIRTEDNLTVETKPNTLILNVGLGFSMVCAVIANVALVVRFLEIRVRVMTLICVGALTIHDIINITAVTIFGIEHRFDDGYTYGTSFWMTLCSTIASTATNLTLIIDVIRTPDFGNSGEHPINPARYPFFFLTIITIGSGLTRKQRSLLIIVIILLCYIALGALIHCILLSIKFVDALYFTICSIETIGFGDVLPVTTGARVFTCTYATFGIVNLALAVGLARETVIEALEVAYRKRLGDVRERRKRGNWRRRVGVRWREAVEWRLREMEREVWVLDAGDKDLGKRWWTGVVKDLDRFTFMWAREGERELYDGRILYRHPHGMHLNLEALTDAQLEAAALEAGVPLRELLPPEFWKRRREQRRGGGRSDPNWWSIPILQAQRDVDMEEVPLTHARLGRMTAMLGSFALAVGRSGVWARGADAKNDGKVNNLSAKSRPKLPSSRSTPIQARTLRRGMSEDFARYRATTAGRRMRRGRFSGPGSQSLGFCSSFFGWYVGSGVFMATEGWSFGVSMYFCVFVFLCIVPSSTYLFTTGFISFTSIGYGDFSPKTPAGRSVFVVWALFGVATMTILISVVSEAYTLRYKNILKVGVFTRMVEKFQAKEMQVMRARTMAKRREREGERGPWSPLLHPPSTSPSPSTPTHSLPSSSHGAHLASEHPNIPPNSHKSLEHLPSRIIQHCQTFRDHIRFLSHRDDEVLKQENVPEGLKRLLDDIIGTTAIERTNGDGPRSGIRRRRKEEMRDEILQDRDTRQTLFALSIERELRKMIEAAEDAMVAMRYHNEPGEQNTRLS
ncbi:Potassium channel [Marasmius tenuissimus]|uniref:Potassium channel n=1 Tax=Marasmius tenuissimus TaxID=585030 RepID=A0ABR2ZI73_9AGAR